MSMILDAMKRSKEGETKSSDVPTVDTVHFVPEPEPRFSKWQMGGMLVVGGLVIAGVLSVLAPSEPASRSTPPSVLPSAEGVKTPDSFSQGTNSQSQGPEVQQPKAPRLVKATAPPSTPQQESLAVVSARRTQAPKPNGTLIPAPKKRDRAVVAKSAASGVAGRVQATQPPAGANELRAIYKALNDEASNNAGANGSAVPSNLGAVGQQSVEADMRSDRRDPSVDGVSKSVRDNAVGSASDKPDEDPPVDFADILAAAQEELGVKPLVESSEPMLETLSQQIKDDIPSLIYSEHRYDPAGSSSVTLNGKRVKERQRVGAFTVIEILPDSVVLRWRETQFRVRARNSWINM